MIDDTIFGWLPQDTFHELPDEALKMLEDRLTEREFQKGEALVKQGDIGAEMFVISSGHADIVTEDQDGQRHPIARIGPGEVVGEMALLAQEPRTADAIAVEPLVAQVLKAETFHTLLEQFPPFGQFLTRLVATRVGGNQRDVLVGREMHGFRITRRLGRGGMAVVYEALTADQERVALKMMSHRLVCDQRSRELFHREADIIEQFDHAHIVKMLGRFEMFYTYFIVVEHIDGLSLQETISRCGRLPQESIKAILGQLASGLDFAHQSGIIHRDIKPGNVMLDRNGVVKLMDFGLAKPTHANTAADRVLVGTRGYLAPELFDERAPSPESDLFALGCLAVELLTGRKLFAQATIRDFITAARDWTGWDVSSFALDVDRELAETITSWLEPSPDQRTKSLASVTRWSDQVPWPESADLDDVIIDAEATILIDGELDSTESI